MLYHSITETIGHTPLVELVNYEKEHNLNCKLYAKLECFNPAGSVKDRIALAMIEDADLLDPRSWQKEREPVFKTDEARKIYGPGHNCFVEGDDGEQLTMLHFRNYEKITGDPLDDHNRHAHLMKVNYDESGAPVFGFADEDLYTAPVINEKQKHINS